VDARPIRRVLCPIDFSDFSRHALDHAVAIARQREARVTALHVFVLAVEGALFTGSAGFQTFSLSEANRQALHARVKDFVVSEGGDPSAVDIEIRESPDVAGQILLEATALQSDLLVMGTHGRSGFDRLLLGSVTEKTLRKAPCPVLTIPRRAADAVPFGPAPYRRILCGVDFSDSSRAAVALAADFARRGVEWLGLAHVIELSPAFYDGSGEQVLAMLRTDLEADANARFTALLPGVSSGATCRTEPIVTTGKPYEELLRIAAERQADLIVLGVQGRGVLDRVLFGSTAYHVVRQAACPVLTLRA
jgi:nucleotide-binding universal stress UspA family protein